MSSPVHGAAVPVSHPVTITIDAAHPGPVIPDDFAGLSFERGPLTPGNAGVSGNLFNPGNDSLVTLFRNMGMHSLRIGGGSVDQLIPAGTGSDGYTGIDNLFAFAAMTGVKVVYTLRLLSPAANPVNDLQAVNARAAGYIWAHTGTACPASPSVTSRTGTTFIPGPGHPLDPAIYEDVADVPGSAYPSYLARWRSFADAVLAAAPGAPMSGPDLGAYSKVTYTPDPDNGMPWTQRLASDEQQSGRVAEVTQHYYVGGIPLQTTAGQAISNMLSAEWVTAAEIGSRPGHDLHPVSLAVCEQPRSGGPGRAALPAHRIE